MKPVLTVWEIRTVRASQARMGFCPLETEQKMDPRPRVLLTGSTTHQKQLHQKQELHCIGLLPTSYTDGIKCLGNPTADRLYFLGEANTFEGTEGVLDPGFGLKTLGQQF